MRTELCLTKPVDLQYIYCSLNPSFLAVLSVYVKKHSTSFFLHVESDASLYLKAHSYRIFRGRGVVLF